MENCIYPVKTDHDINSVVEVSMFNEDEYGIFHL